MPTFEGEAASPNSAKEVVYSQRIVAFLDILAWRAMVAESVNSPSTAHRLADVLLDIDDSFAPYADRFWGTPPSIPPSMVDLIENSVRQKEYGWPEDMQFTQFSDSIILSVLFSPGNVGVFLSCILRFLTRAFHSGVFVRGGITIGQAFHVEARCFGPAVIRAYDLESTVAKYPRVIIDPNSLEKVLASKWVHSEIHDKKGKKLRVPRVKDTPLLRVDEDGLSFLNVLTAEHLVTFASEGGPALIGIDYRDPRPYIFANARRRVLYGLKKFEDIPRILPKYRWLADYYNRAISEYPDYEIEPIVNSGGTGTGLADNRDAPGSQTVSAGAMRIHAAIDVVRKRCHLPPYASFLGHIIYLPDTGNFVTQICEIPAPTFGNYATVAKTPKYAILFRTREEAVDVAEKLHATASVVMLFDVISELYVPRDV